MALKDRIAFGMSLPHRSPDTIDMSAVRQVAQRADALGFRDLWVTENTLDHVFCFDPIVILTYAAAITTKIRVGVSVVVLPVRNPIHLAHEIATLDYASNGRAVLGLGLGRDHHYAQFQIPREKRAALITLVGSGSPIGNGMSEPSMSLPAPAFFARNSNASASNTTESK